MGDRPVEQPLSEDREQNQHGQEEARQCPSVEKNAERQLVSDSRNMLVEPAHVGLFL